MKLVKKSKLIYAGVALVVVFLVGFLLWQFSTVGYNTPKQILWEDNALHELEAVSNGEDQPDMQAAYKGWFTENAVIMKDGSWIRYRSRCHKEKPRIEDVFIGRASNGKFYRSTYHFCIGACNLLIDGQPESLESFIKNYELFELD